MNGLGAYVQAAAGWKHNLAIGMRGQLMSWGWGGSAGSQSMYDSNASSGGQLGLDSEFDFWEPATVAAVVTPAGGPLPQEAPATQDQDASFNWRCLQVHRPILRCSFRVAHCIRIFQYRCSAMLGRWASIMT